MDTGTPKSIERWAIVRRKGKAKFILQRGILLFGGFMFLVMTFFVQPAQHQWRFTVGSVVASACIWIVAGTFYGWATWTASEREYQQFMSSGDEHT